MLHALDTFFSLLFFRDFPFFLSASQCCTCSQSFAHEKPFESDEAVTQSVYFDRVSGWRDMQLGTLDARHNNSTSTTMSRKARRRQARCLAQHKSESEVFGWLSMICGAVLGMLGAVYPLATWACVTVATGVYLLIADLHFWKPLCAALSANFWCATAWIGWCVSPTLGAGLALTALGMRHSLLLFMDPNDIPRPLNVSEPSVSTAVFLSGCMFCLLHLSLFLSLPLSLCFSRSFTLRRRTLISAKGRCML